MKIGPMKNFLHYFNLRQGTILVAVAQLIITTFTLVFFVLGLLHVAGIQEMIVRDTEDAIEREALQEITSKHINSYRMEMAHHNAAEEEYTMYCNIVVVVVHYVSTLLLLYGALKNKRSFMAPWMMVMMTIIVSLIISLFLVGDDCPFVASFGGKANMTDRLLVGLLILVFIYMWLIVYSNYRSLEIKKGLIHEVHIIMRRSKKGATVQMSNQHRIPNPYEV